MGTCQWRGYRGLGMSCISGCAEGMLLCSTILKALLIGSMPGETEVVTDTNNHDGNKDQTCNGGLQSYCCKGFKAPSTKSSLLQDAADAAKDAAEAAAEQLALDIAAKAFCRIAVPALLAPLELVEDLIPFVGKSKNAALVPRKTHSQIYIGWVLDAAEIAATPELINLCAKGIEKEGKAEFKVFGKEHSLTMATKDKPVSDRPDKSTHSSLSTSAQCTKAAKRADDEPPCKRRKGDPIYEATGSTTILPAPTSSVCRGADWLQPCLHYSSVINRIPKYRFLTCPVRTVAKPDRPWRNQWYDDHNAEW
jgi:chitinase